MRRTPGTTETETHTTRKKITLVVEFNRCNSMDVKEIKYFKYSLNSISSNFHHRQQLISWLNDNIHSIEHTVRLWRKPWFCMKGARLSFDARCARASPKLPKRKCSFRAIEPLSGHRNHGAVEAPEGATSERNEIGKIKNSSVSTANLRAWKQANFAAHTHTTIGRTMHGYAGCWRKRKRQREGSHQAPS